MRPITPESIARGIKALEHSGIAGGTLRYSPDIRSLFRSEGDAKAMLGDDCFERQAREDEIVHRCNVEVACTLRYLFLIDPY